MKDRERAIKRLEYMKQYCRYPESYYGDTTYESDAVIYGYNEAIDDVIRMLSRLKDEGEDFTKPVLSVDKITDIKPAEQSDKLTAEIPADIVTKMQKEFEPNPDTSFKQGMYSGYAFGLQDGYKFAHSQFVGEVTDKELKELIQELKDQNPYPESVFIPIPERKMRAVIKLLKDNDYSSDSLYGNWGRYIYDNCIKKIDEYLKARQVSIQGRIDR